MQIIWNNIKCFKVFVVDVDWIDILSDTSFAQFVSFECQIQSIDYKQESNFSSNKKLKLTKRTY